MANYLVVVQLPCHDLGGGSFACESAFAEHLRLLIERLPARFERLLLAAPQMDAGFYEANRESLAHIDSAAEKIEYVPLHPISSGRLSFWRNDARNVWKQLLGAAKRSEIVHSGIADDLWRPTMLFANLAGNLAKRPVIFHVDIDFRQDTEMYRETDIWSSKTYWTNRLIYDPLKLAQLYLAPKMFDLVLLKSANMVSDVGRGAPHVRNFYDTVHSADQVVSEEVAEARCDWMLDESVPLRMAFFGRFVEYKGLDRSIEALAIARKKSGRDLRLNLIGSGDQEARLQRLVRDKGLEDAVTIQPPVPYGEQLFEHIRKSHVQLATPLCEDTPRAAFDAFSQGLPILAFDIRYYKDLESESKAVATATWPDPEALADAMIRLDADRKRLAAMARAGIAFAKENTQQVWLDRRIEWTLELLGQHQP